MRTYIISDSDSSSIPTKAELLTLDVPNFLILEIWDYVMEYAAPLQPVLMCVCVKKQKLKKREKIYRCPQREEKASNKQSVLFSHSCFSFSSHRINNFFYFVFFFFFFSMLLILLLTFISLASLNLFIVAPAFLSCSLSCAPLFV